MCGEEHFFPFWTMVPGRREILTAIVPLLGYQRIYQRCGELLARLWIARGALQVLSGTQEPQDTRLQCPNGPRRQLVLGVLNDPARNLIQSGHASRSSSCDQAALTPLVQLVHVCTAHGREVNAYRVVVNAGARVVALNPNHG